MPSFATLPFDEYGNVTQNGYVISQRTVDTTACMVASRENIVLFDRLQDGESDFS